MSRPSTGSFLLLGAVAAVLVMLVGLIDSADRAESSPRAFEFDGRDAPEASRVPELRAPQVLAPAESAPESAPVVEASPPTRVEASRLVGLVLRPDGEPASGARVVLGQQHGRCGADGRFELALPPDVVGADLIAFEPGYEPVLRPAFGSSLARAGESRVSLLLGAETLSLTGSVTTSDGTPVKNWNVELDEIDPLVSFGLRERVRTDGKGVFLLTDVPAGTHVVRAWKERPGAAFRSEPVAAGAEGLVIVVDAP